MTRVGLEWGPTGGLVAARGAAVVVVVDVLSFTTSVSVAVDGAAAVHPYPEHDGTAREYADRLGAVLAVGRGEPGVSLSPASILRAGRLERLVLPSPNGARIASLLEATGTTVVAAALRNRRAVAEWVREHVPEPCAVAVVPAGERWPDGSLRPAVEDLWGAGAVIAAMADLGADDLSPEAAAAAAAFRAVEDPGHLAAVLDSCASGRELRDRGYAEDVRIAGDLDASVTVPVLRGGAFTTATG